MEEKGLNPSLSTPVFSCIFHVHVFSLLNILPSRLVVVIGVIFSTKITNNITKHRITT